IPFGYQGTRESLRSLLAKALGDLGVAVDRFSFDYPCSAPTRINGQERYIDHDWVNSFRCFSDGLRFHVLVGSPGGWFFKEDRERTASRRRPAPPLSRLPHPAHRQGVFAPACVWGTPLPKLHGAYGSTPRGGQTPRCIALSAARSCLAASAARLSLWRLRRRS